MSNDKPSAGAVRAAEEIYDLDDASYILDTQSFIDDATEIIDRETGAKEAFELLKKIVSCHEAISSMDSDLVKVLLAKHEGRGNEKA